MKKPIFDETKLPLVMAIIDRMAILFEETDYNNDQIIKNELTTLEKQLQEITGKTLDQLPSFHAYWSYTTLVNIAKSTLLPDPKRVGFSDAELSEIITMICEVDQDEAETDYWLQVLKVETGLNNITDYIYYPDQFGLPLDASYEMLIAKILENRLSL